MSQETLSNFISLDTMYEFIEGENYAVVDYLGSGDYKKKMKSAMRLYAGVIGEDGELNEILRTISEYVKIGNPENYVYSEEQEYVKRIYADLISYDKELSEQEEGLTTYIETSLKPRIQAAGTKLPPELKASQSSSLVELELIKTRRIVFSALYQGFTEIICGDMPSSELKAAGFDVKDDVNGSPAMESFEMPLMLHRPAWWDVLTDEAHEYDSVLSGIAECGSTEIKKALHDNDDGTAYMRLWKKDGDTYKPCYELIDKDDAYMNHIIKNNGKALWPGLLLAALNQLGLNIEEMSKEELAHLILGADISAEKMDSILSFNAANEADENAPDYDSRNKSYLRCGFDVTAALMMTGSLFEPECDEYKDLESAISEYLIKAAVTDEPTDRYLGDLPEVFHNKLDAYKKCPEAATPRGKTRLQCCEILNRVFDIYENGTPDEKEDPYGVFVREFTNKLSARWLEENGMEATPIRVEARTEMFMKDKEYMSLIHKKPLRVLTAPTTAQLNEIYEKYDKL